MLWATLLAWAALFAAYTGFRMPNLWSATSYAISLAEGFHRRFVAGTLLLPLARALDHSYWLYASVAFAILAALLAVLIVAALRSPLVSQRMLVVLFFLLPTGGFLFHEVGYLDQWLYLWLFASLALVRSRAWPVAPVLMALAVCTHEIAVLTVLPIFAFVALRDLPPRRAIAVLVPPLLVAVAILLAPTARPDAVPRLLFTLQTADFRPRLDALMVFQLSQSEAWDRYSIRDTGLHLAPLAIVAVVAFGLLEWRRSRTGPGASSRRIVWALGAIAAPALLAFAGWDKYRWTFLLTANFFVVVWWWLHDAKHELDRWQWLILAAVAFTSLRTPMLYFNHFEPRSLRFEALQSLRSQLEDGSLFRIPSL